MIHFSYVHIGISELVYMPVAPAGADVLIMLVVSTVSEWHYNVSLLTPAA